MSKFELLDALLESNNGFIKTSEALKAGVSKTHLGTYVQKRGLERVAHGLYMSTDAWEDDLYVIQTRYPLAVFSHETALYLLALAEREPMRYALTLNAGASTTALARQGIKVYRVRAELFDIGVMETHTPTGHTVRVYNPERTVCDLIRSRKHIDIQDLQEAIKGYVRSKDKNIPLLMRYAKSFSVEKTLQQYLEVLL